MMVGQEKSKKKRKATTVTMMIIESYARKEKNTKRIEKSLLSFLPHCKSVWVCKEV